MSSRQSPGSLQIRQDDRRQGHETGIHDAQGCQPEDAPTLGDIREFAECYDCGPAARAFQDGLECVSALSSVTYKSRIPSSPAGCTE
jgi:hypothetical protein